MESGYYHEEDVEEMQKALLQLSPFRYENKEYLAGCPTPTLMVLYYLLSMKDATVACSIILNLTVPSLPPNE